MCRKAAAASRSTVMPIRNTGSLSKKYMCLLVETMYVDNGVIRNSRFHTERFNRSRHELLGIAAVDDIASVVRVPDGFLSGIFRCRMIYGREAGEISFDAVPPKMVRSLRLVEGGGIDYSSKYLDRKALDALYTERRGCDDIIIVKGGLVTDTFSGNIIFYNGTEWHTPSAPLLKGTMRQSLIESGFVTERVIAPDDLCRYEKFSIISALRLPGEVTGSVEFIYS